MNINQQLASTARQPTMSLLHTLFNFMLIAAMMTGFIKEGFANTQAKPNIALEAKLKGGQATRPTCASAPGAIGGMACTITQSFDKVAKLITAGAYIAGLAFSIGAIMKFKQHKDNPTQVPVGTPIAMLGVAAALLFLPTLLSITGVTMFTQGEAESAGPFGTIFQSTATTP